MKNGILTFITLIGLIACNPNFYGDVNLGSDFYYMVEPSFNSIVIPVNPKKPFVSSIYIIKNIESIGFNKKYILATSESEINTEYWKIDKAQKKKKLGYDENSILKLSNVIRIDSAKFYQTLNSEKIKLKTKTEYRKELNYK